MLYLGDFGDLLDHASGLEVDATVFVEIATDPFF